MYPTPEMFRAARALIGLQQATLAEKGHLSQRTLVAVEQGTASRTAINTVVGVYGALGLTFDASPDYRTTCITWIRDEAPDPADLRVPDAMQIKPKSEQPDSPRRTWGPRKGSKAAVALAAEQAAQAEADEGEDD